MKSICIAGRNDIAVNIIEAIIQSKRKIKLYAIPSKKDDSINTFQRSVRQFATINQIQIITIDEAQQIKDLIFLSVEFDEIVNISKFKTKEMFNIHFSLLPKYKGMYPSVFPILNGDKYSGVTLHRIERGIDTGDIIDQFSFKLSKNETSFSLFNKYLLYGKTIILKSLDNLISKKYTLKRQDVEGSTYNSKNSIDYSNLKVNLNQTAFGIDCQVRAFNFRYFQIPVIHNRKIIRTEFTNNKSKGKAGSIIDQKSASFTISTIDYDLILHIDFLEELIESCRAGDLSSVKKYLKYGVDINEKNKMGWNALMVAVYNNQIRVSKHLIDQGAKVDQVNNNGTTILMYSKNAAINSGNKGILDLILEHTNNIHRKDYFKKDIFDYLNKENKELYNYLKNDKISGSKTNKQNIRKRTKKSGI